MAQIPERINRGGRPPWQPPQDFWATIERYAKAGLSGEDCAEYLGCSWDTLKGTRGFADAWAVKKQAKRLQIAERLDTVAMGEADATMPQAATCMFQAKTLLGRFDRPVMQVLQVERVESISYQVLGPRQVEGEVVALPSPCPPDSSST